MPGPEVTKKCCVGAHSVRPQVAKKVPRRGEHCSPVPVFLVRDFRKNALLRQFVGANNVRPYKPAESTGSRSKKPRRERSRPLRIHLPPPQTPRADMESAPTPQGLASATLRGTHTPVLDSRRGGIHAARAPSAVANRPQTAGYFIRRFKNHIPASSTPTTTAVNTA